MTLPKPILAPPAIYQDAHLTVNFERETARLDGAPLKLTYKAYCLLAFLARRPGELVSREELLRLVWGYTPSIRTRTLDVHMRRVRKSLGRYGTVYIETVFGIGYRFQPDYAAPQNETPRIAALCAEMKPRWKVAGTTARSS